MALQKTVDSSMVIAKLADIAESEKPRKKVLDEETYTDNIKKIIERDFFPDLPKLQAQAEYLDALKRNDTEKLRAIHIKYGPKRGSTKTPSIYSTPATFETPDVNVQSKQTPRQTADQASTSTQENDGQTEEETDTSEDGPMHNPECSPDKTKRAITLDKYLAKNTSEDNAAFEEIMVESQKQHQLKHAWLHVKQHDQEKEREQQLALPGIEQQAIESGSSKVNTWTYTPRNAVMYVPDGVEKTVTEKLETQGYDREIIHNNTRFKANPFNFEKGKEQLQEAASNQAQILHGKVGPDGKEILPQQTPKVNGYGFVGTPSPAPGVDASPLMTWGEIEGTPFRLDGSDTPVINSGGQGPVFRIPQVPKRDRIALDLAEAASKSHRSRKAEALKRVSANFAPGSPKFGATPKSDRLASLSPAAQKLASAKLGIKTHTDKALRASYTPSPSRSLIGDKTPLSLTPGSSRKTPTPGQRTPSSTTPKRDTAEVSSLTDNLLNLPKRVKAHDFF